MTVLAHLSDPHFGTESAAVQEALLEDLHAAPVDLVVVTGDITQRARTRQFRAARAFLDALPAVSCIALPGNHDLPLFDWWTRLRRPYGGYRRFVADALEPHYTDERLALLCVDATRVLRHKHGVLGGEQIERAARRLACCRQPFRVLATHQPLAVPVASERHNLARGAAHALGRWISAGVDLFLGGHIHLPYCLLARAGPRAAVVSHAGTAISRRTRPGVPNSYTRITLDAPAGRMRLERRDYDASLRRFAAARAHEAVRQGAGGWALLGGPGS
jgi:3',5'-cyclic AMP phosphodiesterase CpdA